MPVYLFVCGLSTKMQALWGIGSTSNFLTLRWSASGTCTVLATRGYSVTTHWMNRWNNEWIHESIIEYEGRYFVGLCADKAHLLSFGWWVSHSSKYLLETYDVSRTQWSTGHYMSSIQNMASKKIERKAQCLLRSVWFLIPSQNLYNPVVIIEPLMWLWAAMHGLSSL